jgi:hypothetical protein
MIKAKILLLCLIGFAFYGSLRAQTFSVSDFVETKPPKVDSKEWYKLNYGMDFRVLDDKNSLQIEKAPQESTSSLAAFNGTLVGVDHGEWGGELTYVANGKKGITVKQGNVKFLFEYKGQVYFIESLAHGLYNGGALFRLLLKGTSIEYEKVMDFDDAPQAMLIYGGDLLIASFGSFCRIHNFDKETIFKDTFWESLYPNSLITLNNNIYMGIRGGYVRIDLKSKGFVFYEYKNL